MTLQLNHTFGMRVRQDVQLAVIDYLHASTRLYLREFVPHDLLLFSGRKGAEPWWNANKQKQRKAKVMKVAMVRLVSDVGGVTCCRGSKAIHHQTRAKSDRGFVD